MSQKELDNLKELDNGKKNWINSVLFWVIEGIFDLLEKEKNRIFDLLEKEKKGIFDLLEKEKKNK